MGAVITRRLLLRQLALAGALPRLPRLLSREELPPVRAITRPPGHHWFGYYDKLQFGPEDRLVLGMRVGFEGRTPRADDEIAIGTVDLEDGDRWTELGTSTAWGWQQGCMLQWRPGHGRQVLWNDREEDRYVCRLLDVETGKRRTVPWPVYSVAPDGEVAVGADFRRIQALRPGYGYVGLEDPHGDELAPEGTGLFRVDLGSGERELLLSLAEIAAVEPRTPDMDGAKHYVNHLLVSPDGARFVFLHRWRPDGGRAGFRTRMFTADLDGGTLHLLDPSGHTSHFIWRDAEHVAAWTRPEGKAAGYYLFRDRSEEVERLGEGVMTRNGHLSYLADTDWILNDTYPDREAREQHPYLYHVPTGRRVPLGHFHSPPAYRGEWRCDTHPRSSRDGTKVVVDSPHGGDGRQMWLIDASGIVS